jgi:hypothetical protein
LKKIPENWTILFLGAIKKFADIGLIYNFVVCKFIIRIPENLRKCKKNDFFLKKICKN